MKKLIFLVAFGLVSFLFCDISMEKFFPERYWNESTLDEQIDYLLVKTDIYYSTDDFAEFVNWMSDDEYNQYLVNVRKIDPDSFPFDSTRNDYHEDLVKKGERLTNAKIKFEKGFRLFEKNYSNESRNFLNNKINELKKRSKEKYLIKSYISKLINEDQENYEFILFSFTSHETTILSIVAEYLSSINSEL